ncbi:MAG: linked oxidase domain protein [Frankiales bacterium]|nr:linked oxidase domain protein [Frankiales bacterium]
MTAATTIQAALQQVCATSPDLTGVESDWTGRVQGTALALALPATTDEVAAVLAVCRDHGVGVTLRGGGTGLVAGAVPQDTVVLSTRRLDRIGPVEDGTVVAGAGVTLAQVQDRARRAGWDYGVDFASRASATVGGSVATNAGGLHVIAHGTTRAQVLGAEAVLADGSVLRRLGGLAKDATGYDLSQLLVGSEGTLGVITAVRLRLIPLAGPLETALVGCSSVAAAVELVAAARRQLHLNAAELVPANGIDLVRRVAGLPAPLGVAVPAYVLLQAAGLTDALGGLPQVVDAAVAQDGNDADRLWAYRERLTEAVSTLGVPHKLDVSLPQRRLAEFLAALPAVVEPHLTYVYGHLGDGNVHVNVLGPAPDDDRVDEAVLRLAAGLDGSIGAEHGIGRQKRRWLHLSRSPAELAAMHAVKAALDPTGLLNPGVLLPD